MLIVFTTALWSRVLEDEAFVDDLIRDNCLALNGAASLLKRELRGADIKTVGEPTAGLFFFIDLRDLLAVKFFPLSLSLSLSSLVHKYVSVDILGILKN